MKKHLLKLTCLTTLTLFITACGGGSSTPTETDATLPESNVSTPTPIVENPAEGKGITVCSGSDQGFATATVLSAGSKIQQIKDNPNIRLWHLQDGTRKACVVSGSAEVL